MWPFKRDNAAAKEAVARILEGPKVVLPPANSSLGYVWEKVDGGYQETCGTCGSNCGQCADSGQHRRFIAGR